MTKTTVLFESTLTISNASAISGDARMTMCFCCEAAQSIFLIAVGAESLLKAKDKSLRRPQSLHRIEFFRGSSSSFSQAGLVQLDLSNKYILLSLWRVYGNGGVSPG
jgi:hypothetical protein